MTPDEMGSLIEAHLRAEAAVTLSGAVANYTEDIEHDVVSPVRHSGGSRRLWRITGSWSRTFAPTARSVCAPVTPTTRWLLRT